MAAVFPFRALRPVPAAAFHVAAVPYDVVSTEEARALAAGNPLSFLRVSRAEIDLPPDTNPYSDTVYTKAVSNLSELRARAPLMTEDEPSLYVYRLHMGDHVQTGLAGCYSLDEYEGDAIKRHEGTRPDKEDDRTRHMLELRAQTGPVFLTYRACASIDRLIDRATKTEPLFDFWATDQVKHTVWRANSADERELVAAFDQVSALYIADGHHRAASASRARRTLGGTARLHGEWDTFLAVAFPDTQVRVLAYNRIVKDLAGQTPGSLLSTLRGQFTVREGPAKPDRRGEVAMFVDGRWHTIVLGEATRTLSPAERLDVNRLQSSILTPLLGIGDARSDKRIDFVGGRRGTSELETLVTSGRAAVAFSMYPVSVSDLMDVCDAGGIMPPKSTWFEPKLRDGLLSHLI